MAELGAIFNANDVEPGQPRDFSAMPPGPRLMCIINSDMRKVKPKPERGDDPNGYFGQYLWLEIEIMDGEFERRKLFEHLTLDHANPQTVQIAQQRLREICLACKKPSIKNSDELHNIPFIGDLIVEPDNRTKKLPVNDPNKLPPVNRIKSFMMADDGAGASFVPSAPKPMQQQMPSGFGAAPAAGFNGTGASAGPRPASGALPWGSKA